LNQEKKKINLKKRVKSSKISHINCIGEYFPVNVTTQIEPVQDKNTYSLDPVNVTTQIEPVQANFYLVLVLFE
jgi:hypothetical protein